MGGGTGGGSTHRHSPWRFRWSAAGAGSRPRRARVVKRNSTQDGAPRSEGARPAPEDVASREDRRASADAVEKRRAARRFNDLLLGGDRPGDGRTERRRRRLLEELAEGVAHRGRRALKPIDVLSRVEE